MSAEYSGSISANISGNRLRNYAGTTDGLWGTQALSPSADTASEPINQNFGGFSLVIDISNTSVDQPIDLHQVHLQSWRDRWGAPTTLELSSGAQTQSYTLGATEVWYAQDIDLSDLLSDLNLEPGESISLTLNFTGAQRSHSFVVDNVAVSGRFSAPLMVRWGQASGQLDIVNSYWVRPEGPDTTFQVTNPITPSVGGSYYSESAGYSPVFYGAGSSESAVFAINNLPYTDRIEYRKKSSQGDVFSGMLVWNDFLVNAGYLEQLRLEIQEDHWSNDSYFRWVIQDALGNWYVSTEREYHNDLYIDQAAVLNWYSFTPFVDGDVVIGDFPVSVDLLNVASLGFYFESTDKDEAERNIGAYVRYFAATVSETPPSFQDGVQSFDTGLTITSVRNALEQGQSRIIGASDEGTVVAMDYTGTVLWSNPLSGLMVRDIWCDDLDGDGDEEILVAVADGSIRCLNVSDGTERWAFFAPHEIRPHEPNNVPMNSVCTIRGANGAIYIAAGGFDKNFYWVDVNGNLIQVVKSSGYSEIEPWGNSRWYDGRYIGKAHAVNFLRPVPQADGTDRLLLLGYTHMKFLGRFYFFDPLGTIGEKANPGLSLNTTDSVGALEVSDPDQDGNYTILMGSNSLYDVAVEKVELSTGVGQVFEEVFDHPFRTYRYSMILDVPYGSGYAYFILCGNQIILHNSDFSSKISSVKMPIAPSGMWHDRHTHKVLLASAQSGGSAIHVVDPSAPYWTEELRTLDAPGKMREMRANYNTMRAQVNQFVRPEREREPDEFVEASGGLNSPVAIALREKYGRVNPFFYDFKDSTSVEEQTWRASVPITRVEPVVNPQDEPYLNRTDGGITYDRTRQQLMDQLFIPETQDSTYGFAFRAGHGNDPYYFNPDTLKEVIDLSYARGNGHRTMLSWAEVQTAASDYIYPLDRLYYEILEYLRPRNGIMVFNNKNLFWNSIIYKDIWRDFVSGKYRKVFVPNMEESTSKTPELSLSGRIGLWASGSFDTWGMRTTRDNTSYDRTRELAAQMVPNHFLRQLVYRIAHGGSLSHSTYTDPDYMHVIFELVASGALYMPRPEEIVSFSPVHFSIKENPDERYIQSNNITEWSTYYDAADQDANPMVIGRMEGAWKGGMNTEWDFSHFATGVPDRRLNFIPPFPHGMVLMTPVENGVYASDAAYRTRLLENLHPIYRDILQEFVIDGRNYLSSDGSATYAANSSYFYDTVKPAVENGGSALPVTLSGDPVGWVCAQSAPRHLRLTLVDSGYLNPQERAVTIHFNTVTPVRVVDVLSGESFPIVDGTCALTVPLGMFRLLEIEITAPLKTEWDVFVVENGLSGSKTDDWDGDGLDDFLEFAIGENPRSKTQGGSIPELVLDGMTLKVRNAQRGSTSVIGGAEYQLEWTEDLKAGLWSSSWDSVIEEDPDASLYHQFERTLDISDKEALYIRMKLSEPGS
ncbi:MAG: hypothetical protein ACPGN3_08640 [Opitutales bacterium]